MQKNRGKIRDLVLKKMGYSPSNMGSAVIDRSFEAPKHPENPVITRDYAARSQEISGRAKFAPRPTIINKISEPKANVYSRKVQKLENKLEAPAAPETPNFSKTPKMISKLLR